VDGACSTNGGEEERIWDVGGKAKGKATPYLAKRTNHEALHYAVFSTFLSLHPSLVRISSSAPCSQTPSAYVPPLASETRFRTHTKSQAKLKSY
jgi:hypothetical protein